MSMQSAASKGRCRRRRGSLCPRHRRRSQHTRGKQSAARIKKQERRWGASGQGSAAHLERLGRGSSHGRGRERQRERESVQRRLIKVGTRPCSAERMGRLRGSEKRRAEFERPCKVMGSGGVVRRGLGGRGKDAPLGQLNKLRVASDSGGSYLQRRGGAFYRLAAAAGQEASKLQSWAWTGLGGGNAGLQACRLRESKQRGPLAERVAGGVRVVE